MIFTAILFIFFAISVFFKFNFILISMYGLLLLFSALIEKNDIVLNKIISKIKEKFLKIKKSTTLKF